MKSGFDCIIYGAGLAGAVLALKYSDQDKKVLLLNQYGFPGGVICECLCCLQKIDPTWTERSPRLKDILSTISKRNGVLYNNGEYLLLDPEIVKIALQDILVASRVHMLFHIFPVGIDTDNITVLGKEGNLVLNAEKIIDASEDRLLAEVAGRISRSATASYYNMIVYSDAQLDYESAFQIKLPRNRFWISFPVREVANEDKNYVVHELLESLRTSIHKKNGRIHTIPARIYTDYIIREKKANGPQYLECSVQRVFQDELIMYAAQLDEAL